MSSTNDRIKILVLGDSGVGKSSLVHLMCHGSVAASTQWTIGCSIEIKLHQYKEGTSHQKTCCIELWDIGGSRSHSIARKIFFNSYHGIILVQDLTNRKSEQNLKNWLGQAHYCGNNEKEKSSHSLSQALFPVSNDEQQYDVENLADINIPVMIVATKQDLVAQQNIESKSELVDFLKCERIFVNSRNVKSLAPGTTNSVKLSCFLDKVCDKKFQQSAYSNIILEKSLYQRQTSYQMFNNNNKWQ